MFETRSGLLSKNVNIGAEKVVKDLCLRIFVQNCSSCEVWFFFFFEIPKNNGSLQLTAKYNSAFSHSCICLFLTFSQEHFICEKSQGMMV
ncbi:hypothetical protein HanRHA438_Chr12g0561541 [Helianthus annuus]|nr:hypothetical protein HanIR_Chr12g0593731 [Helianthus annuus]KAJ0867295.1 hypothetical protein HanRHA438_Chr12g0561541 [Helianthus annuus]